MSETTAGRAGQQELAIAELSLPRPPGVFRRMLAKHPRAVDWFIVGAYLFGVAAVIVVDLLFGLHVDDLAMIDPEAAEYVRQRGAYLMLPWLLVTLSTVAITALTLLMRRRRPLFGVIVTSLLMTVDVGLVVGPNSVALMFLLFATPIYGSVKRGWIAYAFAAISSIVVLQFVGYAGQGLVGPGGVFLADQQGVSSTETVTVGIFNALWLLLVLMMGINVGNRQRYVTALIDRVHQLAREREQRAQLAAAAERSRIAREMHDVVAHSLSVVVTLSEAASVAADARPAEAKRAMERAAETGRSALMEMRRLLGVLAEDGHGDAQLALGLSTQAASLAPQPGAGQLPELVAGFVDAGLRVSLSESGSPANDAAHQLAVYRIVQEGLTNALRHAGPGAAVTLTLRHESSITLIEIEDSGPILGRRDTSAADTVASMARIPGGGRGLQGIEQRAALFDGEVTYGPKGDGWNIRARVPFQSQTDTGERA